MLNMNTFLITILGGVIVGVLVHLIRIYILERESPLPFVGRSKVRGVYKYIEGDWYEYHITRNIYISSETYWLMDKWKVKVRDGFRIKGLLKSPSSQDFRDYPFVGEIREGRLIITGSSAQTPQDYFTAIFPEITIVGKEEPIVGTMMAFDYQDKFYISPMILSRFPLDLDRLNEIVKITLESSNKPINQYRVHGGVKKLITDQGVQE